ncbi:MAG: hypothetical protein F4Y44_06975 [Chloroflexi bacterium]|nr:hypothetical protein [Chloroflexota bacterium]
MTVWAASQTGLLLAQNNDPLDIVIVDRHATGASEQNRDLAVSFIGLLSELREDQRIGFIATGKESAIGPAIAGSPEHGSAYRDVVSHIEDSDGAPVEDLTAALSYAHELMKFESAGNGSTVYVISGGELDGEAPAAEYPLGETINAINREGWQVVSVALPGSSTYAKEFMRTVSGGTGSDIFPLSTPQELKVIADQILREDAKGTLFEIGQDELAPNDVFSATLEIPPSTTEASLVFFKQGSANSFSLHNPSGLRASEGDRALSSVVETPHVIIWTLTDPAPGKWTIDVRGGDGFISAWHYPKNTLGLHLVSFDTIPHDSSTEFVVYVSDGSQRVTVPDAELRATIITEGEHTFTHSLNDNGEYGDAVAGDAYYSTTVPPLGSEGEYEVELELHWPQHEHTISTRTSVMAQAFPVLDVNLTHVDGLRPGERVVIGTAEVKVNGQPYAVPTSIIDADISSASGNSAIELVPRELLNQGHAWAFDIVFTPGIEEYHTILFRLSMNYAARDYTFTSDSEVLSSYPIPQMQQQPVVAQQAPPPAPEPAPEAPAAPPVQTDQTAPPEESSGNLTIIIALAVVGGIVAIVMVAGAGYAIYGLTKPEPFGYITDEEGEVLVNFSTVERSFTTLVQHKNLLLGEEIGIPELRGLSFYFSKEEVDIRSSQTEPSIRVNNRPLIAGAQQSASRQSWIGTQGKLYSLHLAKPEPQPAEAPPEPTIESAVGDD